MLQSAIGDVGVMAASRAKQQKQTARALPASAWPPARNTVDRFRVRLLLASAALIAAFTVRCTAIEAPLCTQRSTSYCRSLDSVPLRDLFFEAVGRSLAYEAGL